MMKQFFVFLILLVTGCYSPGEEGDPMAFKPLEWGQTKKIKPADWGIGQKKPITIVEKSAEYSGDGTMVTGVKNPVVKNLTLGTAVDPSDSGDYALRWKIRFGVGGGSTEFVIDADSLQQLSISADTMTASLFIENISAPDSPSQRVFSRPTKDVEAVAFYTEGMTATDPPTYTQAFRQADHLAVSYAIPAFVSSFRILGDSQAANSPFSANTLYELIGTGGFVLDSYTGDEILGVRLAPIPTGIATVLKITTVADAAEGSFQWEIDA